MIFFYDIILNQWFSTLEATHIFGVKVLKKTTGV